MKDSDINLIENYKTFINSLLTKASQNEGKISRVEFDDSSKLLSKPEATSNKQLLKLYESLIDYEKTNTDDKLRGLFNKIDKINADITISLSELEFDGSLESDFLFEDIDEQDNEVIKYFTDKGIKEENIIYIPNLSGFISFTSTLSLDYLSRGQRNYKWNLLPSALRINPKNNESLYSEDDVQWMFAEFKRGLKHYDKAYTSKKELELKSYAQHYSIPTNLIDFTEAHSLSLLFALEDYDSEEFSVVYFVDAMKYNTNVCFKGKPKPIPNCSDENCDAGAASIFIKSDNVNERIHFQKGFFLKVPDNYTKNDLLDDLKDYTKIILIAPEVKENILTELFSIGITFQNIYPDLNNLANSIKFRNRIKQRGNLDE